MVETKKKGLIGSALFILSLICFSAALVSLGLDSFILDKEVNDSSNNPDPIFAVGFVSNSLTQQIYGQATATVPSLTGNTISEFSVSLKKPSDLIVYTFIVENTGNLDAIISDIVMKEPTCTGMGDNAMEDQELVCSSLIYRLTKDKIDGDDLTVSNSLLKANNKQKIVLSIGFSSEELYLPNNSVKVGVPDIVIYYKQVEN